MSIFSSIKKTVQSNLSHALKNPFKKSSQKIIDAIASSLLNKKKIDSITLEKIEEALISTDMGYDVVSKIITNLSKKYFDCEVNQKDLLDIIKSTAYDIFTKNNKDIGTYNLNTKEQKIETNTKTNTKTNTLITKIHEWQKLNSQPYTITLTGMNGSGKTTTIAKIAHQLKINNINLQIICGDMFRAAATEQLIEWGKRINIPVIYKKLDQDVSGFIFDSIQNEYINSTIQCCIIDTSGRLHTNKNLMAEINKIERVLSKIDNSYPNESILVIDASIGQAVYNHIEEFQKHTKLTGLIITKIDNSAKGGIILGIANKFSIPVYFLGIGESIDDLIAFDPHTFIENLFNADIIL